MKANFTPSFDEEVLLCSSGVTHVIGIDEVGVGAFAGPVVIAGVIFDASCREYFMDTHHKLYSLLHQIHDSKLLLPKVRETLALFIQEICFSHTIVEIPVETINTIGIRKATFVGMRKVVEILAAKISPDIPSIIVDGFTIPDMSYPQKPLIKGDQKSVSIAAASIIAKVYRDAMMQKFAEKYPQYHFEKNKGYGTKNHRDAIQENGLCDMHRSSFNLTKFL
jgi:ribonuclease HII